MIFSEAAWDCTALFKPWGQLSGQVSEASLSVGDRPGGAFWEDSLVLWWFPNKGVPYLGSLE